ncbi:hypothetical protein KDAU_20710 [Dictyobacter aurantiacus]|uniref:Uncharacterized protein n=1 Tax=Dictyobacter aurantiacus TaxID=1936993 RepID=A0A401ZD19_9CHLR|nr:hypothetical protein KDAU_20710 [Dictyobacter aurantiacus]
MGGYVVVNVDKNVSDRGDEPIFYLVAMNTYREDAQWDMWYERSGGSALHGWLLWLMGGPHMSFVRGENSDAGRGGSRKPDSCIYTASGFYISLPSTIA